MDRLAELRPAWAARGLPEIDIGVGINTGPMSVGNVLSLTTPPVPSRITTRLEPLPFQAMQSYPFGPDEVVPDSPAYREYLGRYQTREQDPNIFWRHLVLPARKL